VARAAAFIQGCDAAYLRLFENRGRHGRPSILIEHDLFGKPVSTFPDHARKTSLENVNSARYGAAGRG
jgi:hypothetical protein